MLSSTVKKLDASKFDGVAEFDNTEQSTSDALWRSPRNLRIASIFPVLPHRFGNASLFIHFSYAIVSSQIQALLSLPKIPSFGPPTPPLHLR